MWVWDFSFVSFLLLFLIMIVLLLCVWLFFPLPSLPLFFIIVFLSLTIIFPSFLSSLLIHYFLSLPFLSIKLTPRSFPPSGDWLHGASQEPNGFKKMLIQYVADKTKSSYVRFPEVQVS